VKRTELQRKTPLQRKPMKSSPRVKGTIDREASEAWARHARKKRCVVCGAKGAKGHHIITQQQLRIAATELDRDYESLRWDLRNLLPLCERHHTAHHSRAHVLDLLIVLEHAPKVAQFARELDLFWYLQREYRTT
jgi:5-methylcytosine-specific restriction endonuclease McrA